MMGLRSQKGRPAVPEPGLKSRNFRQDKGFQEMENKHEWGTAGNQKEQQGIKKPPEGDFSLALCEGFRKMR